MKIRNLLAVGLWAGDILLMMTMGQVKSPPHGGSWQNPMSREENKEGQRKNFDFNFTSFQHFMDFTEVNILVRDGGGPKHRRQDLVAGTETFTKYYLVKNANVTKLWENKPVT